MIGRYVLYDRIASGGMAAVHLGRLMGPIGFARTVAIKRLHEQYAQDPEFVTMFVEEARVAARIRHPNVVPTLDVTVTDDGELFLVMEYVHGEALSRLIRTASSRGERIAPGFVATIVAAVLHGLHAAHEARGENNEPLSIVHRDVSPQNVLVGVDGVTRVLDFGIAKAAGSAQTTREGQLKGKLAYMPPEQIEGAPSRASDVYAASAVLWEALTGRRLFVGDNEAVILKQVLDGRVEPPSRYAPGVPPSLDALTLRGLSRRPEDRFASAAEMAIALEDAIPIVPASKIGPWVQATMRDVLEERSRRIAAIEADSPAHGPALASATAPPLAAASAARAVPELQARLPTDPGEQSVATQLSTGLSSEVGWPSRAARRSRRAMTAIAAAAVAAALAIAVLFAHREPDVSTATTATAAGSPRSVDLPASAPVVASSAPAGTPPAPPGPVTSVAPAPSDRVSPPPARAARPSPSVPPPAVPSAPARPPPAHRPPSACSPPYYFDAEGNRVFKRECL